jgi:hypothetical protein
MQKFGRYRGIILFSMMSIVLLGQERGSPRAPFSLDFPDLRGLSVTAPEATLPTADLHRLLVRLRKPVADDVNYGKIYTKINGEAAGVIQSIRSDQQGYVIALDLDSRPRFKLHGGKNVVEVQATDRNNRSYYASYVLLANSKPDDTKVAGMLIENIPAATANADQGTPMIYISQPTGTVRPAPNGPGVVVKGTVTDDASAIASVTINGQPVELLAANRDSLATTNSTAGMRFERTVPIKATDTSIVVVANDRAGNATRLTIPVKVPEPTLASQFKGRKFAVVVGISHYKDHDGGLNDLSYADADARAFRDFLQRKEGGSFAANDILYFENEQATIEALRTGLRRFIAQAGANDMVLVFLAGHGTPDPYAPQNLYYLLHDSKVADLPNTALPMTELEDVLDHGIRAQRVLVFVDTCHSAGLSGQKITKSRGLENNLINLYASRLFTETGRAVLTSSDINEVSVESTGWGGGHGIFTWALLEGLRGKADTNSDHFVTAGELFDYVRDRVRAETAFTQNPRALPGLNTDLTLAFVNQ